jgi:[NiFe] hydrogenase diaphorase moiety large subunit
VQINHSIPAPAELSLLLARHHNDRHALVQLLREFQVVQGWLPREALSQIAEALGVTLAHVEGVAGFYRFFRCKP